MDKKAFIIEKKIIGTQSGVYRLFINDSNTDIYDNYIGDIDFSFSNGRTRSQKVIDIHNLYITDQFRNMGYGSYLIKEVLIDAYKLNYVYIELDDMTDNYRKEHNIYLKLGFKYIANEGCEMRGKIKDMIS